MFEQSFYQPEPIATPTQEGDFLHNYEVRNWELGPRIYKIIGAAAAFHLVALLVVAQTSLLTMKGCDSPLVGRVCQVLDTIYVASQMFGTEREYVDAVYEKTQIGDDEEITFVDVTGETPPLSYPEGYWQIADPAGYQAKLDAMNAMNGMADIDDLAGFPSSPPITTPSTGSLIDTPPVAPTPNPNVVQGQLPSFGSSGTPSYRPRGNRGGGRVKQPADVDDNAVAEKTPEKPKEEETAINPLSSDAVLGVEINKRPLTDFADDVATKWAAKEIDLNQPFIVVMNAALTKDGKLDPKLTKYDVSKQKGDQKMIDVAKAALEAIGDSGYLTYLKSVGIERVNVTLAQDDKQIIAVISAPQSSPERANTIGTAFNNYISLGKIAVKNPSDERVLLDSAKAGSNGKDFVLNFTMPKPVAHEMITRKLTEAQAKKLQRNQPNGTSTVRGDGNTALK
jgi:hypothetical protein